MTDNYTTSPENQLSWRDVLPVHPAAEMLPRMSGTDLKDLGADIAANGQLMPVVILLADDGTEQLLDGVNRLDAMDRAGIAVVKDGAFNRDRILHQHVRGNCDPDRFVFGVNIHRRHLTNEQKSELIRKLLERKPELSDRQIASITGTSHPTVAKVRAEMEASGKITTSQTRIDKRGSERSATKPPKPPPAATMPEMSTGTDRSDEVAPGREQATEADLAEMSPASEVVHAASTGAHHSDEVMETGRHTGGTGELEPAKPKSAPSVKDPPKQSVSEKALEEIKYGTRIYMPKMTPADRRAALEDMAAIAAMSNPTLVLGVLLDLPSIDKSVPKTVSAMIATAFNRLNAAGVDEFFAHLSPDHRHDFKHISENAKAEIVKHARETTALLTHPEQHCDEIRKKMARIMSLAAKSNMKLNTDVFPHPVGLDTGEAPSSTKH